jgi:hypothetical protein
MSSQLSPGPWALVVSMNRIPRSYARRGIGRVVVGVEVARLPGLAHRTEPVPGDGELSVDREGAAQRFPAR